MDRPTKIMAILSARPGKAEALLDLLHAMRPQCHAEPGNLRWDIWRDSADPERFVLDELYVDAAAAAAHRQTPHFQDYAGRVNDLAERTALTLDPVEVR
jgi:quinol monooxygenase YgiN